MKKLNYLSFCILLTTVVAYGCIKENSRNENVNEESIRIEMTKGAVSYIPPIKIGLRINLYRPKYNCLDHLSLCIGRKRGGGLDSHIVQGIVTRESVAADATFDLDNNEVYIQFLEDFDKSDGTTFIIDSNYNTWNLTQAVLDDLNVNTVDLETGSYILNNYNSNQQEFGDITIPAIFN